MVESTRDSVKCFHSWKHFNQSPTSSLFTITSYFTTWTRFAAAKPRLLATVHWTPLSFSFTNWKPSAAGFNWRGEVDLQGSILLSAECGICKANFDEVVGQNGLEPSTSRLSVVCSSQLSYWPILVEISGIEPLTSCLQGRRSPSWAKPPNLFPSSSKVLFFLYPLNWITLILLNTLYWP